MDDQQVSHIDHRLDDLASSLEDQAKTLSVLESRLVGILGQPPEPGDVRETLTGEGTSPIYNRLNQLVTEVLRRTDTINSIIKRIES